MTSHRFKPDLAPLKGVSDRSEQNLGLEAGAGA